MKILAINGSPRGKDGHTDIVLQNLLIGMQGNNHSIETIYLNKFNIKPCAGCMSCWFKTPGKCIYNDDMQQLLPKLIDFDLIIIATPLYVCSMPGILKNFIDRTIQLDSPLLSIDENIDFVNRVKRYGNNKTQKMLLIASAGFPELEHFNPLIHTFKCIAEGLGLVYIGEILKPTAALLTVSEMQAKISIYKTDLQLAGKQLAADANISEELQVKLHEPWIAADEYWKLAEEHWRLLNKKIKEA